MRIFIRGGLLYVLLLSIINEISAGSLPQSASATSSRQLLGEPASEIAPQIFNGKFARPGQFPYIASLYATRKNRVREELYVCSGVLVSRWVVATSVSCLRNLVKNSDFKKWYDTGRMGSPMPKLTVRVGGVEILSNKAQKRRVVGVEINDYYFTAPKELNRLNADVALLRLHKKVKGVKPPTLAPASLQLDTSLLLNMAGFGAVATKEDMSRRYPRTLRYAAVRPIPETLCRFYFKESVFFDGLLDGINTTFCTAGIGIRGAAPRDEGAPLVTRGRRPKLVGIVTLFDPVSLFLGAVEDPVNIVTDVRDMQPWMSQTIKKLGRIARGRGPKA